MPTYAFKDDEQHPDESNQNTASLIRNWLGSSMDFFRVKKFSQKHAESTERRKQEKQAELDARAKYYKRFEEQKQKHSEAFFRERPKEITIHSTKYAAAGNELSNSWLEEYNHPSSTANVSIHEVMGVGEVHTERAKSKNNTSFADSSLDLSSSFNSTAKSLFSTSILGGNGIPGSTGSVQKLPTDQLETYTGSRPSFGITTLTSTPVAKLFTSGNSLKPSTLAFPVTAQQPKTVIVNKPPSLNKPETIIQKPQLNSIPEANDAVQEPTVNKIPSNSIEKAAENRKVETPVGQKKSFNNLVMYYSKDLDLKEDNDLAKDRFEKSGETALRGTIKRTINEKLVVCSKKHANPQELEAAVEFLSKMISGKTIKSHNGQKFQVTEEEAIAYIRDVVISYCMGVVERDNDLVHVLATILRGVSRQNSAFESVLLGHLFINSALLTLDQQICTKFAETVASNPGRRLTMYNKEKSTIKLFMALHLNTESGSGIYSRLDMRNLWRTIAIVCNSPPCVISTVVLSTLFLEICADKMGKIYSKQFTKLTNVMKEQLLPLLERNLQSSQLCQAAGEASLISVLCNGLESL